DVSPLRPLSPALSFNPTQLVRRYRQCIPTTHPPAACEDPTMSACLTWLAWSLVFAAPPSEDQRSPGWESWKQGQAALQAGEATRGATLFEESRAADPKLARNYLSLAAAWLDRGDEAKACLYLALYVAAHPEHAAVRFQYIDLLHRLKRDTEMRLELEELTADLQDQDQPADDQLLHCHSPLMQLAEAAGDDYEEDLHRGIGRALLTKQKG